MWHPARPGRGLHRATQGSALTTPTHQTPGWASVPGHLDSHGPHGKGAGVFAGMRSLWATVVMQGWQLGLGLSILSPSLA